MTADDKLRDEELQCDINREAAKISALLSGKTDKCEYLTGEEMLPSNQRQIIEQAKFVYSFLGKALEKQIRKQADALKSLNFSNKIDELNQNKSVFPQNKMNDLVLDRLEEIMQLQIISK